MGLKAKWFVGEGRMKMFCKFQVDSFESIWITVKQDESDDQAEGDHWGADDRYQENLEKHTLTSEIFKMWNIYSESLEYIF